MIFVFCGGDFAPTWWQLPCGRRGVYTLRVARTLSLLHILSAHPLIFMRAHSRMAQGRQKDVCCMCVVPLHLAFSVLLFHLSLLFLHAHSGITFLSIFLPNFPVLEAQDTRNSSYAARSLATWPSQMQTRFMTPTSSTRSLPWTVTLWSSTNPDLNEISDFEKPRTRTQANSVFSVLVTENFILMMR